MLKKLDLTEIQIFIKNENKYHNKLLMNLWILMILTKQLIQQKIIKMQIKKH